MATATRFLTFLAGVFVLVVAVVGCPLRWGLVIVGLLLMGVVTFDQFRFLGQRIIGSSIDHDAPTVINSDKEAPDTKN